MGQKKELTTETTQHPIINESGINKKVRDTLETLMLAQENKQIPQELLDEMAVTLTYIKKGTC